jgi:hypothetical protein
VQSWEKIYTALSSMAMIRDFLCKGQIKETRRRKQGPRAAGGLTYIPRRGCGEEKEWLLVDPCWVEVF